MKKRTALLFVISIALFGLAGCSKPTHKESVRYDLEEADRLAEGRLREMEEEAARYRGHEPGTPVEDGEFRPGKIEVFKKTLTEYNFRHRAERKLGGHAGERAHMLTYFAFMQMHSAYGELNESERQFLYKKSDSKQLPKGMQISQGEPVSSLMGIKLTSDNPREDFEWFLKLSFMEVDYTSTFQWKPGEFERLAKDYSRYLKENRILLEKICA